MTFFNNLQNRLSSSNFIQHIGQTFATRAFLIVVGFVSSIIATRLIGPEGRGILATIVTIAGVAEQFGNFGLHASNTYYVSKERDLLPYLTAHSLMVSGFTFIVTTLIISILKVWGNSFQDVSTLILLIGLASIPFGLSSTLMSNLLLGIGKIAPYNISQIFPKVFYLIGLIVLALLGYVSVETLLVMSLCGGILSFMWVYNAIRKELSDKLKISFTIFREHLKYGFKAYLAALFAFLVIRSDILLIQHYVGFEATGYYSIAFTLTNFIYLAPTVISTILFPRLTSMAKIEDKLRLTMKSTFLSLGLMLPFVFILFFFGDFVIRLVYGAEFISAFASTRWLSIGILFLGIQTVIAQFLASEGFPFEIVFIWCVGFIANVIANIILIPILGIEGAAISSVVTYFTVFVLIILLIIKRLQSGKTV